jgi:anti-sigma-K factor RskA
MSYSEDHIVLAAEYVLGTLDAEERAQADTMMSVDAGFRVMVERWESKLGELNAMVGSVEPPPGLWEKIRVAAQLSTPQLPLNLPEIPPPPPPAPIIVAPDPTASANVMALSSRAKLWRNIASGATAIAAALVAVVVLQALQSDLLPNALRSKPLIQTVQVPAPPMPAQFVAVLQKGADAPAFILTVDIATKAYTVRKVGAEAEQGRSYELWLVSDRLQRPRSLGVIGNGDFTMRPVLADYDTDMINKATYAVTIEPEGGSPTGVATGPIVFTGRLVETVPAAAGAPTR